LKTAVMAGDQPGASARRGGVGRDSIVGNSAS
jgi:hypothetical protein